MLSPDVLNHILRWLLKENRICLQAYKEIVKPSFPALTYNEAERYFARLESDGYARIAQGMGIDTEIEITSDGKSFITKRDGGYKLESSSVGFFQRMMTSIKHNIIVIITALIASLLAGLILHHCFGIR